MSNYVTDLDDTLIMSNGAPREALLALLLQAQADGDRVIVVSGRRIDRMGEVSAWLEQHGLNIPAADIHLSDFPEGAPAIDFKVYKAKLLLDEGVEIEVWFENDADTRAALAALGINTMNPSDVQAPMEEASVRVVDPTADMRNNARTGLRYYAEGKAGDGVTAQTIREARDMARGIVSDDKWVRIAAWIARHRMDWEDVPRNNDPSRDDFPGAGAVAAYLWGVDPTSRSSADTVSAFAMKAAGDRVKEDAMVENRDASGATDLPIGDRFQPWDGAAAEARVREWAGGSDNMDWAKYGQAFFYVDAAAADQFGGYKLQFADIVNGELTAMPRGVFAVAAALAGSRGGVDLPAGDVAAVKARVAAYYARMADEFQDDTIAVPFDRATMPAGLTQRFAQLFGKGVGL